MPKFLPGNPIGERNPAPTREMPLTAPYPIVPSDSADLPVVPYGIYVGTGGDVKLRGVDGSVDVTYKNLPDASYINVAASRVYATGTTAGNMIAEA